MIKIENFTKDFGEGKGVFDCSFSVNKGETVGFLGPNGAGKSTTIRHLMGFCKPDKGIVSIFGMNSFDDRAIIQNNVGYLAGETSFFKNLTVLEVVELVRGLRSLSCDHADDLLKRFELDGKTKVKTMSLGEKRKLGIVVAFMHDPDLYILDEPTNGLDPLMQQAFLTLLKEKQQQGKTILMSSHRFDEVEKVCSRVVLIKEGKIVADKDINGGLERRKRFVLSLSNEEEKRELLAGPWQCAVCEGGLSAMITTDQISAFLNFISRYKIEDISVDKESVDDFFMQFYGKEGENV